MRTLAARYAAWCRRQGTTQCNPGAIGLGTALVIGWIIYAGIGHEVTAHRTGLMQAVSGAGAVLACLAAAALVYGALRMVENTPVPVTSAPEAVPADWADPDWEDRDAMRADADALADGSLDFVVTGRRGLFELDERNGARP